MTSQPGAGGDAVDPIVEQAASVSRSFREMGTRSLPYRLWEWAEWIVRWSDTVAAAQAQEVASRPLESPAGYFGPKQHSAWWSATDATEQAVRSALTPRDEKEGG